MVTSYILMAKSSKKIPSLTILAFRQTDRLIFDYPDEQSLQHFGRSVP